MSPTVACAAPPPTPTGAPTDSPIGVLQLPNTHRRPLPRPATRRAAAPACSVGLHRVAPAMSNHVPPPRPSTTSHQRSPSPTPRIELLQPAPPRIELLREEILQQRIRTRRRRRRRWSSGSGTRGDRRRYDVSLSDGGARWTTAEFRRLGMDAWGRMAFCL
jgi:hypothetical protein